MINGSCHCNAVKWKLDVTPESATSCNCTVCRRYGVIWAYGIENVDVRVSGETKSYTPGQHIGFHFCNLCGCVAYWRSLEPNEEGKSRIAVNLRLAELEAISNVPVHRFDGLESFRGLPTDGRCVVDFWP